jgi:hypothetical protein
MEEYIVELILSIIAALIAAITAFLRSRYAGIGDKVFAAMGDIVKAMRAAEALYPQIKDLNDKLEASYQDCLNLWNGGEFTGWKELTKMISDFYAVYAEIQKIIAGAKPSA